MDGTFKAEGVTTGFAPANAELSKIRSICTRDQELAILVSHFYACIKANPKLGPLFDTRVTDWDYHKNKMFGLWQQAICDGASPASATPAEIERQNDTLEADLAEFSALFEQAVRETIPPDASGAVREIASRLHHVMRLCTMGQPMPFRF